MHSTQAPRRIILASASPRRKELLELIGVRFEVVPSSYNEDMTLRMSPRRLACFLSAKKAEDVALRCAEALVIAADTFIDLDGHLLGKPQTTAEAIKMLRSLNNRSHRVITGFTVLHTASGRSISKAVVTTVYFKNLTQREINAYVASGEPMDKAGAYAIQGLGSVIVNKIDGDYFNVIGLPLNALVPVLQGFGVKVLKDSPASDSRP
ncbi:MAG: septum formation inhibitor Maf [Thermodesulfovibrio sp.]|nr:septum formation inhibitor Maf [Thermodesulfovibrio sp.]